MDCRERVKRAIRREGPDRLPILFINKDREQSDIILVDMERHFLGEKQDRSEWGFRWERRDRTMGQPEREVLGSLGDLDRFPWPDPRDQGRFAGVPRAREEYPGRYYLGSLVLTGFTIMSFLRGFSRLMVDLLDDRSGVEALADRVFGFEEEVIRQMPAHGMDGVAFYDDWGTQSGMIVSPGLWRELFKERYRRQFDLAHAGGLDVYFHTCGLVEELIPDLIEIGVDMLNLSQPNLYDIEALGRRYGGKACFVCPVSYQTTSITGTREQIFADVRLLVESLGRFDGGLIGYVEEYGSIGMSEQNYAACVAAFRDLGGRRKAAREENLT